MVNEIDAKILSHELQLKEQLNECVHEKRRSDFSLMLAMLNDDIREQSQFILPETSKSPTDVNDQTLRKRFELANAQSLAVDNMEEVERFDQAENIQSENLADIKLKQALNPLPLAFRDDAKHIPTQVISNTSIHCQQRHQSPEKKLKKLDFDAAAWLNAVQNTIVKSQLMASA